MPDELSFRRAILLCNVKVILGKFNAIFFKKKHKILEEPSVPEAS